MFDGLRRTLSEQIDKTRDHGSQQYWDLLERLELGHTRIEKLQTFIAITMRHIGRLEGQIRSTGLVKSPSSWSDPFWGLQFDNGLTAFILCDPEGNRPGHLEIQKGGNDEDSATGVI